MVSFTQKVLLSGLDCAIGPRWRRYAERGDLPVGRRLMAEGVFAAWGFNYNGQLGLGDAKDRRRPTRIPS